MDKIFEKSNVLLEPIFLISVYSSDRDKRFSYGDPTCYMEYHEVNQDGSYAEAIPMPEHILNQFATSVSNSLSLNHNYHGEIPSNLFYYHQIAKKLMMVWHTPPQQVPMFFDSNLKLKNKKYHVPGLVWSLRENNLYIYAYKEFKGRDTELFYGPFHNTLNASVCIGSAKLELHGNTYADIMSAWEQSFWMSKFVHISGSPTHSNLTKIYKNLGNNEFPLDELKEAKLQAFQLWQKSM